MEQDLREAIGHQQKLNSLPPLSLSFFCEICSEFCCKRSNLIA